MTAIAETGQSGHTHDIILTLNGTEVALTLCDRTGKRNPLVFSRSPLDRSTLKTYSGVQKFADMEPPWTPIVQSDWSGGRGSKDFDINENMYFEGNNVNTTRAGEIILGPKATLSFPDGTQFDNDDDCSGDNSYFVSGAPLSTDTWCVGWTFDSPLAFTMSKLTMILGMAYPYAGTGVVSAGIGTVDGSNLPTSITWSTNSFSAASFENGYKSVTFNISKALSASTEYYIIIKLVATLGAGESVRVHYYHADTDADHTARYGYDGPPYTSWVATSATPPPQFSIEASSVGAKKIFFEFYGAQYCIAKWDDDTGSSLYINGTQGIVETTGTDEDTIVTRGGVKTWTADEAIGCKLVLYKGTGSEQPDNVRTITDNDATGDTGTGLTVFTVDPPFDVAPVDGTIFNIVACDTWTEITGFETAYPSIVVTDVLVANGSIYLACGDDTVMKRINAFNSSGTWTYTYSGITTDVAAEDSAAKYTFLKLASDAVGTYIWGAKRGYPAKIYYAEAVDNTGFTGTDEVIMSAPTAVSVGDLGERITGLDIFFDYGELMVLKEGGIYRVRDKVPYYIDVREMGNTRDMRNGLGHTVHGKYLYFTWHDTVMRYIEGYIDRVGPDKADVAVPNSNCAGNFSCLTGYYGEVIGAMDAGDDGYSTVLSYNGQGWCELFRAPVLGDKIQSIYIQSIPGNTVDRLWISAGSKIYWIPLSIDPYNHPDDSYEFSLQGYLTTAWYYIGLRDIEKMFNSLKIIAETTAADEERITAEYRVDDGDWTAITGTYDAFSEELFLTSDNSLSGIRIQFKLTLISTDGSATPRIISTVVESAVRLPTKYVTSVMVDLVDDALQYDNAPDTVRLALTKFNNLITMQESPLPAQMESVLTFLDTQYAFVDGVTPYPIAIADQEIGKNHFIVRFDLIEIG